MVSKQKRELRRVVRERVLAMTDVLRAECDRHLCERWAASHEFAEHRTILLYIRGFPEEIETTPLLQAVLREGKRLVCPRVDGRTGCLELFEVRDLGRDVLPGYRGIPEPSESLPRIEPREIDLVVAPGLAFTPTCQRLGRGRGHYDRLFGRVRPVARRVGLAYDEQIVEWLPIEPHDQSLHSVWTPTRRFLTGEPRALKFFQYPTS